MANTLTPESKQPTEKTKPACEVAGALMLSISETHTRVFRDSIEKARITGQMHKRFEILGLSSKQVYDLKKRKEVKVEENFEGGVNTRIYRLEEIPF